jgi:hypothetical protein
MRYKARWISIVALLFLLGGLGLAACSNNITPTNPQQPPYTTIPPDQGPSGGNATVVYNYGDTGPVQLSNNNLTLQVGQTLTLQPAPGLTKNTRFTSSGENFFGDIMQQQGDAQASGKAVFKAIKAGKGRLQIIPNTNETDRATDLWVTVQ